MLSTLIRWPSNFTPRCIPKRYTNLYTNIHNSMIHNSQKVETPQMPPTDEWINKTWYTCKWNIMSYIKNDEVLMHVTPPMNLDDMLSWGNQTEFPILQFCLFEMPRIDKLTEIESRLVIARSKNMKRIGSVISNTAVWSYGCECNRKQGKRKDWRKQVSLEVRNTESSPKAAIGGIKKKQKTDIFW